MVCIWQSQSCMNSTDECTQGNLLPGYADRNFLKVRMASWCSFWQQRQSYLVGMSGSANRTLPAARHVLARH